LPFALIRNPARRARLFRETTIFSTDGTELTQLSFRFEPAPELSGTLGENTLARIILCAHFELATDAISAYRARIIHINADWRAA
jgi:hypothetical protein